jgi:arylformamidase
MQIRQLTRDDAAEYLALRLRALREHPDAFRSSFEEESAKNVEWSAHRLAGGDGFFLGAFESGTMIGTVGVQTEARTKLRHQATVIGMYVAAEHARHGVGRALVDACIARSRDIGTLETLILTVTSANAQAVRLYRRAGFVEYGREPRTMRIGDRYYDKTMMVLDLRGHAPAAQRIFDISPTVQRGFPVFPGDTPFEARWSAAIGPDSAFSLSAMSLSPHTGAHADAPLHYDTAGASIGEVALEPYLGACRVIHAFGARLIAPHQIETALAGTPPRVLIRSYRRQPKQWDDGFAALDPAAIDAMHARGVRLIGIDTPSIDPARSRTLDSHQAVQRSGMAILEGLVLDEVPEGDYELIALPLKWAGIEASPVRAILRELPVICA